MQTRAPLIILFLYLLLVGLASYLPIHELWGINHLAYLSWPWHLLFWGVAGMAIGTLFVPAMKIQPAILLTSKPDWLVPAAAALLAGACFYLLRADTHFLGDGYNLLSTFSRGDRIVERWAEPASTRLVRLVQSWMGEFTRETTYVSFATLSILSGVIFLTGTILLARQLRERRVDRLLFVLTTFASGLILLFFGYVEYYPLLIAVGIFHFWLLVRYCRTGSGFVWVLLTLFIATSLHLQALILAPGLLVALWIRLRKGEDSKQWLAPMIGIGGCVSVGLYFLIAHSAEISQYKVLLPRVATIDRPYALFSRLHLFDLLNQWSLIIPLLPIALTYQSKLKSFFHEPYRVALIVQAIAGLAFFLIVNPALGMGRDWDLMVLPLLPLLILTADILTAQPATRQISISAAALGLGFSICYCAANLTTDSSVRRFEQLVKRYEQIDATGWPILGFYHLNNGEYAQARRIAEAQVGVNPRAYDLHEMLAVIASREGRPAEAIASYQSALELKPRNASVRNRLAQLFLATGRNQDALSELQQARSDDPAMSVVVESMALAHIRLGNLDDAQALADSVGTGRNDQAGGCLIRMVVSLAKADTAGAKMEFENYRRLGAGRSDYENISSHYEFLLS